MCNWGGAAPHVWQFGFMMDSDSLIGATWEGQPLACGDARAVERHAAPQGAANTGERALRGTRQRPPENPQGPQRKRPAKTGSRQHGGAGPLRHKTKTTGKTTRTPGEAAGKNRRPPTRGSGPPEAQDKDHGPPVVWLGYAAVATSATTRWSAGDGRAVVRQAARRCGVRPVPHPLVVWFGYAAAATCATSRW